MSEDVYLNSTTTIWLHGSRIEEFSYPMTQWEKFVINPSYLFVQDHHHLQLYSANLWNPELHEHHAALQAEFNKFCNGLSEATPTSFLEYKLKTVFKEYLDYITSIRSHPHRRKILESNRIRLAMAEKEDMENSNSDKDDEANETETAPSRFTSVAKPISASASTIGVMWESVSATANRCQQVPNVPKGKLRCQRDTSLCVTTDILVSRGATLYILWFRVLFRLRVSN